MHPIRIASVAALALCAAAGSARAQATAPAAGDTTAIPEKTAPGTAPATSLDTKSGALSDKLSGTDGVIKPTEDVDPAMDKAAPQTGTMPVVKPGQVSPGTAK